MTREQHVASNAHTKFRPVPTPSQFAANPETISRATIFLRRELRVWNHLDVEVRLIYPPPPPKKKNAGDDELNNSLQFLTAFIISLMKSIDIRAESSIKLLAEFLDMDSGGYVEGQRSENAEHLAHGRENHSPF